MKNAWERWGAIALVVALTVGIASAASDPSRDLSSYVILGLDKIQMRQFFFLNTGNIGTNNPGAVAQWGSKAMLPDGSQVATDVLGHIGRNSSLYDLFANMTPSVSLNRSVVRHDGPTAWSPPLIPSLPIIPPCTPSSSNPVYVGVRKTVNLAPGTYGTVKIDIGGTLILTGGSYCFADWRGVRGPNVIVQGPSQIVIAGKLRTGAGAYFGPGSNPIPASGIRVYILGKIARVAHRSHIYGSFYEPNGQLSFGRGNTFIGQFIAKIIRSAYRDTFTLQSCGNGIVEDTEQCDPGPDQQNDCCDANCHFRAAGTPCDDNNVCSGQDTCGAFGVCIPGDPIDCNPHNPCKLFDCDPQQGCTTVDKADNSPCHDDDVCNGDEICLGGHCVDQPDLDCNDNNGCTTDSCDPILGCLNTPVTTPNPNCPCVTDADCDNHNVCDGIETCVSHHCVAGTPLVCTGNGNPCMQPGCDPGTGCVLEATDGAPCDDGDPCTDAGGGTDVCDGSVCTGFPIPCSDGNPCTTDDCNMQTGQCVFTPIPDCPSTTTTSTQPNVTVTTTSTTSTSTSTTSTSSSTTSTSTTTPTTTTTSGGGGGTTSTTGPSTSSTSSSTSAPTTSSTSSTTSSTTNTSTSTSTTSTTSGGGGGQGSQVLCTLTQGAYGAPRGAANGNGGWVTVNQGLILPTTIGLAGQSVTVQNKNALIAFLPAGGTAKAFNLGDVVIGSASQVPDPQGSGSGGDGAGVLAGQTLSLSLSVKLSNIGANPPGLSTRKLANLCTCGSGASHIVISQCLLDALGPGATVSDLLVLANQALGGLPLISVDPCVTYSGINDALDAINQGFDGCKTACTCP